MSDYENFNMYLERKHNTFTSNLYNYIIVSLVWWLKKIKAIINENQKVKHTVLWNKLLK